jgi:hypothetical protein
MKYILIKGNFPDRLFWTGVGTKFSPEYPDAMLLTLKEAKKAAKAMKCCVVTQSFNGE